MTTHRLSCRAASVVLTMAVLLALPLSAEALVPDSGEARSLAAAAADRDPAASAPTAMTPQSTSVPGPVVVDYTGPFRSSTPARLARAGVGIAVRYVGSAKWKCLTRREANALRRSGIDIAAVYETKANWMLGGYRAGVIAARKARAAVRACGGPRSPFVYFACDVPTKRYSTVNACLRGAAAVLGRDHVGIYGSYSVCDNALKSGWATKAWQTEAWSYGKSLAAAALYQNARRCDGSLGLDYDSNFARAEDLGQWGYKGAGRISWARSDAGTTADLRSLEFANASTGLAVGANGTVIRSSDGGTSWSRRSTPVAASLAAVSFPNASVAWAVGADGAVVHSADGGSTWTTQSVPTTAALESVHFTGATRGWAAGEEGIVLATADGGSTWTTQSVPTTSTLKAVHFAGATSGWVTGEGGTIFCTTDGGQTWKPQLTPTTTALTALEFMDSDTGWAAGEGGVVLATRNGGATWTRCATGTSARLRAVHFVDAMIGWVAGDGGTLLRTTDGGASWTPQAVPTAASLASISFVEGAKGWVVGDSGTVLRAIGTGTTPYSTITGVVKSASTGRVAGGVRVSIGSHLSAPTSPDGTFIAARLRPGTYSVGFTDPRYVSQTVAGVRAAMGVRASVRVSLTPRTATALSGPSVEPTVPLRGLPVTIAATLSPLAAAAAAPVTLLGWHYETKTVRKKVRGHVRKVKVKYWRLSYEKRRYADAAGRVAVQPVLAPGRWHFQARFAGTGRLLPSASGLASFRVN